MGPRGCVGPSPPKVPCSISSLRKKTQPQIHLFFTSEAISSFPTLPASDCFVGVTVPLSLPGAVTAAKAHVELAVSGHRARKAPSRHELLQQLPWRHGSGLRGLAEPGAEERAQQHPAPRANKASQAALACDAHKIQPGSIRAALEELPPGRSPSPCRPGSLICAAQAAAGIFPRCWGRGAGSRGAGTSPLLLPLPFLRLPPALEPGRGGVALAALVSCTAPARRHRPRSGPQAPPAGPLPCAFFLLEPGPVPDSPAPRVLPIKISI